MILVLIVFDLCVWQLLDDVPMPVQHFDPVDRFVEWRQTEVQYRYAAIGSIHVGDLHADLIANEADLALE